jgi:hypothetical protein
MASRKKGKTIHIEARDMINHVNHQCKQEAVEKSGFAYLQIKEQRTIVDCRLQL